MDKKVLVIPCSGIGKPVGSIGRDATFQVVDNLRKDETDTICLSLLVMGDEEAKEKVKESRCIAVDGCPLECAKNNIELAGGNVSAHFRVVDVLKENRELKTAEVTFLDENGRRLSQILAEQIAEKVDELGGNGE